MSGFSNLEMSCSGPHGWHDGARDIEVAARIMHLTWNPVTLPEAEDVHARVGQAPRPVGRAV